MNHSEILRILRLLTIVVVLALAGVGLEHTIAALSQASDSAATVAAQPTATATVAAPPPVQVQPTATAAVTAPPPAQVKVEGRITAVNAATGTITVQDDDGPPIVVALGAVRGTFYVWQKVKVYGTLTSPGSNGATVQAQFIQLDS